MTDSSMGRKAGRVCILILFVLLLVAFPAIVFDFYYDLNDDTLIKDIVSGAYMGTPSGYSVQLLFPLSWAIAVLYQVVPNTAWYGLFLCVCQFGAVVLIAIRLTALFQTTKARIIALLAELFIFYGLFLRELVIVQYSVTAGMCMMCAVFLIVTSQRQKQLANALLLVVLAFMIRTEVCLMLLPFVLCAGLFRWAAEEKIFTGANFRKYLSLLGCLLLCLLFVFSFDMLAYHADGWENFRDFFDARTKLYDFYELPDYGENKAFYDSVGLSKESYTLLENYNFALDESIDTWLLNSIAQYQETKLCHTFGLVSKNSVRQALWLYKERLLHHLAAADIAVAVAYGIYVGFCLLPAAKNKQLFAALRRIVPKIALVLVIRSVLWLYLYMMGRVLDRVTMPLLMTELACVAGLWLNDMRRLECGAYEPRKKGITAMTVYLLVIFLLASAFAVNYGRVCDEYEARARADKRWYAFMDYCRTNAKGYYVVDVYSATSYEGASYSEKMFQNVDNRYKNYDYCGGWLAKSPLARKKLADRGFRDMQSALLSGTNVFFVAAPERDMEWMETYYAKRGVSAQCRRVDEIRTDSGDVAFFVYDVWRGDNETGR